MPALKLSEVKKSISYRIWALLSAGRRQRAARARRRDILRVFARSLLMVKLNSTVVRNIFVRSLCLPWGLIRFRV